MRNNNELPLSAFGCLIASTLIFGAFTVASKAVAQTSGNLSLVCATRPEVLIRDFYTGNAVGQLDRGECMEVVSNVQHSDQQFGLSI